MEFDSTERVAIHRRPALDFMPLFHRNYGLWIFSAHTNCCTSAVFDYDNARYFEFYALSHLFEGSGHLWIQDGPDTGIHSGDCVIITPGTVHHYGSNPGEKYFEDTVNFCGPAADMLFRAGIIENGLLHAGSLRRLLPIIEYAQDPALDSQLKANIELQKLLVDFHLEKRLNRAEYPLFDELLHEVTKHLDRWWTVEEMAERCNLSGDQLRRVFQKYTGGTPKAYVDRLKLQRAGELLVSSEMKLTDIAESLGYTDVYHFARRFKDIMGMSPGRYRNIHR